MSRGREGGGVLALSVPGSETALPRSTPRRRRDRAPRYPGLEPAAPPPTFSNARRADLPSAGKESRKKSSRRWRFARWNRGLPRSGRLALDFLLVILGDVLVDPIRKLEVFVDVGRVRIFRVRHDRELLVTLPFQDSLARGRAVVVLFDLPIERPRLDLGAIRIAREERDEFLFFQEVAADHREDEPSVVADVAAGFERLEQVAHHPVSAQV